jgi:phosphohistidine phosphatase
MLYVIPLGSNHGQASSRCGQEIPEVLVIDRPAGRLLMVRHAIAEERDVFARTGQSDGYRPLTEKGKRRMQLAARGLYELVDQIDLLATSPLVRAVQTAEILSGAFGGIPIEETDVLATGPESAFLAWYRDVADRGLVAVVGHEPYLGEWASWLAAGPSADFLVFKKGGGCLLEFPGPIEPGSAILHWHVAPAHLRVLGGSA